jgi:hypothetical protein
MHVQILNETAWRGAPRFILTGKWAPCYPSVQAGAPTSGMSTQVIPSCGCGDGLGWLGDAAGTLTAQQAISAALAMYAGMNFNPKDHASYLTSAGVASQVQAGVFDSYAGCHAQAKPMSLIPTAGGIAVAIGGATTGIMVATHVISAVTGAVLGAAMLGAGVLISIVAMIFAHHAAAVARDMSFICGALPAVNNSIAVIKKAVQDGTTTPQAAIAALDEIYSQFMTAGGASGGPSGPMNIPDGGAAINKHPYCNAACELSMVLKAMVLYWQSQFAAMEPKLTPAAAGTSPTAAGTIVSTGTPGAIAAPAAGGLSFGLIAAALVGAFFLFK